MQVVIGKTSGFCMGVKRAIEEATKIIEVKSEKLGKIENIEKTEKICKIKENKQVELKITYCLGELVHNPQVIQNLEKKGLKVIENLEDIPNPKGKKVIFRAHGVTKQVYEKAKQLELTVEDFSCPKVLAIHEIAKQYVKKGITIFFIGEKEHPEVIGTASFCGENSFVIQDEKDLIKAISDVKGNIEKLLVIAQTTFNLQKFQQFVETIKQELQDVEIEVKNTICDATRLRQQETAELSKNVDYMIVIGGKKSSNSNKLYQIAKENCENTFFVENVNELENIMQNKKELKYNLQNCDKIGIMAGASTPNQSVQEIVDFLEEK